MAAKKETRRLVQVEDGQLIPGKGLEFTTDPRLVRWSVVLLVEMVAIVAVALVFLLPSLADLEQLNRQLREEQGEVSVLRNKLERLEEFRVVTRDKYEFMTDEVVMTSKDVGKVLSMFNEVAQRSGASIVKYKLDPGEVFTSEATPAAEVSGRTATRVAGGVEPLSIELVVGGDSGRITSFMDLLNGALPLSEVKTIGIRSEEGTAGASFELTLVLDVFWQPLQGSFDPKADLPAIDGGEIAVADRLADFVRVEQTEGESETIPVGNENLFGL